MASKNYYMILDTETCGNIVFDLGFKVIDRKGNMVEEGSFVFAEFIDYPEVLGMFTDEFTKNKIGGYYYELYRNSGAFEVVPFDVARDIVNNIQQKYNAKICAYNAAFDTSRLRKTAKRFGYDEFFTAEVEVWDIWNMALSVLCDSINFINFVYENKLLTEKNNPSTGAETIYRYLTKNADFEEKHTAREDCEIEADIFMTIINRKKRINHEIVGACFHNEYWKKLIDRYVHTC